MATLGTEHDKDDLTDPEAEKRGRMRHDWNNLIEDLIEEGQQRGLFDNLSGAGRPLDLSKNPYEGDRSLANQILKDNDLRPAWLNQHAGIQERTDQLRAEIARVWSRYRTAFDQAAGKARRQALSLGWDEQCARWETKIGEINKLIADYNLRRPAGMGEVFSLRLADELARAGARRRFLE